MTTITALDVAMKAVELAEANPEYIYQPPMNSEGTIEGCWYVHRDERTGEPDGNGCLFGQALVQLGVKPSAITEGIHVGVVLHDLGITEGSMHTDPLLDAMVRAQGEQDAREPWGEAIEPIKTALAASEVAA